MYAQQIPQQYAGSAASGQSPAARIIHDTVLRLKDLDVRIEALNQELAQVCDSVGAPQAAQIARTPRHVFAAQMSAQASPSGLSPTGAPISSATGFAPQANWAQSNPAVGATGAFASPFASPFAGPANVSPFAQASPFAISPFAVANPYAQFSPYAPSAVTPYGASPFTAAWATPQNHQISQAYSPANASFAAQAPFAGNLVR